MATYEVELKRTSFITLFIEAESEDDAETKAWQAVEHGHGNINDAQWELTSIEESED